MRGRMGGRAGVRSQAAASQPWRSSESRTDRRKEGEEPRGEGWIKRDRNVPKLGQAFKTSKSLCHDLGAGRWSQRKSLVQKNNRIT